MDRKAIEYIKEHASGYVADLESKIGKKALHDLETLGFIERGQEVIKKNGRFVRTESYKKTQIFDIYFNLVFPKKRKRSLLTRLSEKYTAKIIQGNIKKSLH